MKGSRFPFTPVPCQDAGLSPRVLRVTDDRYSCNHLYFTSRSFTPDSSKIVFESDQDGGHNLYIFDLVKNEYTQLTEGKDLDYFPYVDRQGKKVFFGYKSCLYSLDLESLQEEILFDARELTGRDVFKVGGAYQSWDGKKIVSFFEADPEYGLIVTEPENGKSNIILRGNQPVRHCQFCPQDHGLIVYAHEGNWSTMGARMWFIRSDGSGNRRVRDHDDGTEEAVGHESWANTQKKLFYKIRRSSDHKIFIASFDVDADRETVIMECPHNHGIASLDDRFFIADYSGGPMWIADLERKKTDVLCNPDMSWVKGMSRFHPHPSVSNDGKYVVYSTDHFGKPGVFIAELPR
jgi:Tol biopolymer transport system component